eukprot:14366624-Alexandrium_andersonii.AAC.1
MSPHSAWSRLPSQISGERSSSARQAGEPSRILGGAWKRRFTARRSHTGRRTHWPFALTFLNTKKTETAACCASQKATIPLCQSCAASASSALRCRRCGSM